MHLTPDSEAEWLKLQIESRTGSRYRLHEIFLSQLDYPLYTRSETSDFFNLKQIFYESHYSRVSSPLSTVLDLGGYIGLSAIYFASKNPGALIILVEPDEDNFILATLNCRPYKNIHCLRAAVWDVSSPVACEKQVSGDWSTTVRPRRPGDAHRNCVPGLTISELLIQFDLQSIDLLKLDIEGTEKRLFEAPDSKQWLERCSMIACELHDRRVPGCRFAAYKALAPFGFRHERHGEMDLFMRASSSQRLS